MWGRKNGGMDGKKARWRIMMGWKYKWREGGNKGWIKEQRMERRKKEGRERKGKNRWMRFWGEGGERERTCKLRQKQGKEGRPGKVRPGL